MESRQVNSAQDAFRRSSGPAEMFAWSKARWISHVLLDSGFRQNDGWRRRESPHITAHPVLPWNDGIHAHRVFQPTAAGESQVLSWWTCWTSTG